MDYREIIPIVQAITVLTGFVLGNVSVYYERRHGPSQSRLGIFADRFARRPWPWLCFIALPFVTALCVPIFPGFLAYGWIKGTMRWWTNAAWGKAHQRYDR